MKSVKKLLLLITLFTFCSCNLTEETHVFNVDMRIVAINSDCSVTNDKFKVNQLCNTILLQTIKEPILYREINTCKLPPLIKINTEWLYNHRIGDTVHFSFLRKDLLFKIEKR